MVGSLNFAICYPETPVEVFQYVDIRVKIRDPDNKNQLITEIYGDLILNVYSIKENGDSPIYDDDKSMKIQVQKAEQEGIFLANFIPNEPGIYHMMMTFNGLSLQDHMYTLQVNRFNGSVNGKKSFLKTKSEKLLRPKKWLKKKT